MCKNTNNLRRGQRFSGKVLDEWRKMRIFAALLGNYLQPKEDTKSWVMFSSKTGTVEEWKVEE